MYEEIPKLPRGDALRLLESDDNAMRARGLLSLAMYDEDWSRVQALSLELIQDADAGMRGTAALALAHLARIHRRLDLDRVLPALNQLAGDPEIGWRARDALDDINTFIRNAT